MLKTKEIKKIAVLRALKLGDLLCSLPFFKTLKANLPESQIFLIGLPWAKDFTRRFSELFAGFIEFPGYPGLPEQPFHYQKISNFLELVRKEKFDLIFQLQGEGYLTNSLVQLLGAKNTAGFFRAGQYRPNENFLSYPDYKMEVLRHLDLLTFLGMKVVSDELFFPLKRTDFENLKEFSLQEPYVCLHPGASTLEKRWSLSHFVKVGESLAKLGFQLVITGTLEERNLGSELAEKLGSQRLNLTGKTDLGTLGALLRKSSLLVCNDTGISHLAVAVKTPSVIVFQDSDSVRWAPLNHDLHLAVNSSQARTETIIKAAVRLLKKETALAIL